MRFTQYISAFSYTLNIFVFLEHYNLLRNTDQCEQSLFIFWQKFKATLTNFQRYLAIFLLHMGKQIIMQSSHLSTKPQLTKKTLTITYLISIRIL